MSQKYYSAATKGFYDSEINQAAIPEDTIEISDEEHVALLVANSRGRIIDTGPDGKPIARDLNDVEREVGRRRARDQMLTDTDKLVARHRDEIELEAQTTLSAEQFKALQNYRAQLRAITRHTDWPRVSFPPRPEGI